MQLPQDLKQVSNSYQIIKMNTIECAFCRSRQLASNHNIKTCTILLNHECERCGQKGHSPSRCTISYKDFCERREQVRKQRWAENQRVKAGEQAKQAAQKTISWVSVVGAKMAPIVIAKLAEDEERLRQENAAKAAAKLAKKQAEKERRDRECVPKMEWRYGLETSFYRVPQVLSTIIAKKGDFWYFHVEGLRDDSKIAEAMRSDPENKERFKEYILEKFGRSWMDTATESPDCCIYLHEMVSKEMAAQEQRDNECREYEKQLGNQMDEVSEVSDYDMDLEDCNYDWRPQKMHQEWQQRAAAREGIN